MSIYLSLETEATKRFLGQSPDILKNVHGGIIIMFIIYIIELIVTKIR